MGLRTYVVPAVGSTVQSVLQIVFVWCDFVLDAVNLKGAVLDAVGIATCQSLESIPRQISSIDLPGTPPK